MKKLLLFCVLVLLVAGCVRNAEVPEETVDGDNMNVTEGVVEEQPDDTMLDEDIVIPEEIEDVGEEIPEESVEEIKEATEENHAEVPVENVTEGVEGSLSPEQTDCNVCPEKRVYVVDGEVCSDEACTCVATTDNFCEFKGDELEVSFLMNNTFGRELNYMTVRVGCTRDGETVKFQGGTSLLYKSELTGFPAARTIITQVKEGGWFKFLVRFYEGHVFSGGATEAELHCDVVYALNEEPEFDLTDSFELNVKKV